MEPTWLLKEKSLKGGANPSKSVNSISPNSLLTSLSEEKDNSDSNFTLFDVI